MAKAEATVKEFVGKVKRDGLRRPAPAQLGRSRRTMRPQVLVQLQAEGEGGPGGKDWGQPVRADGVGVIRHALGSGSTRHRRRMAHLAATAQGRPFDMTYAATAAKPRLMVPSEPYWHAPRWPTAAYLELELN
jgi:hypothetical protein